MGTYITQKDLEARVSKAVLIQILDDDVDEQSDNDNVTRVIADAESYVEGFIFGNYDPATIRALGPEVPNEVKRLMLDVATAFLWQCHPEYVRAEDRELLARAREELVDLREGKTRLDVVGTPEPAANQGGETRSGDPDDTDVADKFFNDPDSFGIF